MSGHRNWMGYAVLAVLVFALALLVCHPWATDEPAPGPESDAAHTGAGSSARPEPTLSTGPSGEPAHSADPSAPADVTIGGTDRWTDGTTAPTSAPSYGLDPETAAQPYPEQDDAVPYGQRLAALTRLDGSLGTVSIPSTGLSAPIYEGTDTEAMIQGAGHWAGSSLGGGNVCLFGHNQGNNPWFYELKDTAIGDMVSLETNEGKRWYRVTAIDRISSQDFSWLGSTGTSSITLITCVAGQPELRLAVRGEEVLP